jgi:hypothetical protein
MHNPFPPAVGALTLGLFLVASTAAQEQVSVGAKPSYEFKSSLYNGRGVKSLADLRGAPTIIEFWGVR